MTNFKPPKPRLPKYATWIEGRREQFKSHTSLGLAKTAITNCIPSHSILYELKDDEWIEIEGGYTPQPCDYCGSSERLNHRLNYKCHPSESKWVHWKCLKTKRST